MIKLESHDIIETNRILILEILNHYTVNDYEFISAIYGTFTVNGICNLLGINRNHYNYLKRIGKLDSKILELRKDK